jgi:hypothetical protein
MAIRTAGRVRSLDPVVRFRIKVQIGWAFLESDSNPNRAVGYFADALRIIDQQGKDHPELFELEEESLTGITAAVQRHPAHSRGSLDMVASLTRAAHNPSSKRLRAAHLAAALERADRHAEATAVWRSLLELEWLPQYETVIARAWKPATFADWSTSSALTIADSLHDFAGRAAAAGLYSVAYDALQEEASQLWRLGSYDRLKAVLEEQGELLHRGPIRARHLAGHAFWSSLLALKQQDFPLALVHTRSFYSRAFETANLNDGHPFAGAFRDSIWKAPQMDRKRITAMLGVIAPMADSARLFAGPGAIWLPNEAAGLAALAGDYRSMAHYQEISYNASLMLQSPRTPFILEQLVNIYRALGNTKLSLLAIDRVYSEYEGAEFNPALATIRYHVQTRDMSLYATAYELLRRQPDTRTKPLEFVVAFVEGALINGDCASRRAVRYASALPSTHPLAQLCLYAFDMVHGSALNRGPRQEKLVEWYAHYISNPTRPAYRGLPFVENAMRGRVDPPSREVSRALRFINQGVSSVEFRQAFTGRRNGHARS